MTITQTKEGSKLTLALSGRLDTTTAPDFEKAVCDNIAGISELILDLKDLQYTSSAGLRVFLKAQKMMNTQGSMKVLHVTDDIMEVFEITGFSELLTIA